MLWSYRGLVISTLSLSIALSITQLLWCANGSSPGKNTGCKINQEKLDLQKIWYQSWAIHDNQMTNDRILWHDCMFGIMPYGQPLHRPTHNTPKHYHWFQKFTPSPTHHVWADPPSNWLMNEPHKSLTPTHNLDDDDCNCWLCSVLTKYIAYKLFCTSLTWAAGD